MFYYRIYIYKVIKNIYRTIRRILIFFIQAGGTSHDENILNSVEVYDTVSGNWKLMKEVDTYYSQFKGPSAVCHNKSVYVVSYITIYIQFIK